MSDRIYSGNSDKPDYNFDRLKKWLNSQKEYIETHDIDPNIRYRPEFSPGLEKELNLSKDDYSDRVNELINLTLEYPRSDKIENPGEGSFTYEGFDIPEATHRRSEYDKKRNEAWSKDIDKKNRLIYRVYDNDETILFMSIKGHDLDKNRYYSDSSPEATKLMQYADSNQEFINQLEEDIDIAMENGYFETEDYEIECNEYGIFIHDKIYDEITYADVDIDGLILNLV